MFFWTAVCSKVYRVMKCSRPKNSITGNICVTLFAIFGQWPPHHLTPPAKTILCYGGFPPKSLERGNVVVFGAQKNCLHFPVKSRRGKSFVCDPHFAKDVFGCSGGYIKHVAVLVSITREARSRFKTKNRLSYLATEKGRLNAKGGPLLRSINNRRALCPHKST